MAAASGSGAPVVPGPTLPVPPMETQVLQPQAADAADASNPTPTPTDPAGAALNVTPNVKPQPAGVVEESGAILPESLSGRFYLMVTSTLAQDDIESVWEALDEIAGSGAIVDNRLVSREDGIQFTLDPDETLD